MLSEQFLVVGQFEQKNRDDGQQKSVGNLGNEYQFNRTIA